MHTVVGSRNANSIACRDASSTRSSRPPGTASKARPATRPARRPARAGASGLRSTVDGPLDQPDALMRVAMQQPQRDQRRGETATVLRVRPGKGPIQGGPKVVVFPLEDGEDDILVVTFEPRVATRPPPGSGRGDGPARRLARRP